ncbi:hypothetical protein [Rhizomonospora bruguierae]|uniref:hypothetical protein n=1 Tax=Rhizomonospora bruguierae TaxID=1581705 RepID=UPI001BCA9891|nr:hypothetical protein [Micromonospora sp. NBRC 107566]
MIVVGATMTGFATGRPETCLSWLRTAEALADSHPDGVRFFAALELDGRGRPPFEPVFNRLHRLGGEWWTFTLDDGRTEVTSGNRYSHICAGRNLITDYALSAGASHILHLDADMCPPPDALPKLLTLDHPLVGGEVPTYNLRGPAVAQYPFRVESHMNTAGFLLVERSVFRRLRWRWDMDAGMSDDPCYHADARELLGVETYVRKDVIGRHWPENIPPLEGRGYDLRVVR